MTGLISAHVLYGLDSLILCVGLGQLCRPRRVWFVLASAFGLADGAGALLGSKLAEIWPDASLAPIAFSPAAVAAYGLLVLAATARVRAIVTSPFALACMPILLSLDNLAAAASSRDGAFGQAAPMTITTASLALAGCWLGSLLAELWPASRRILPGGAALVAAAIMSLG